MKTALYKALIATAISFATFSTASANVTYDVQVDYSGGFRYSFSMVFADGSGIKSASDLISPGGGFDFIDETLTGDYGPWSLSVDGSASSFLFDPSIMAVTFASGDIFESVSSLGAGVADGISGTELMFSFSDPPSSSGFRAERTGIVVGLSTPVSVPLPSSAILLTLGLILLRRLPEMRRPRNLRKR